MNEAYLKAARKKLFELYRDMACNVTMIYRRTPIHLAYDLVAHSAIGFTFKGQRLTRGWVEGLVIGDTRTGKSEIAKKMMNHYRMGRYIDCDKVSFAGIVGGMQQIGKGWNIQWGLLPMNDKRMGVLDEAHKLEYQAISEMAGMRSGGVAEINKIQQESTQARCRLLWIANLKDEFTNRRIDSYASGVQTIPTVMGRAENIARLDFAVVVSGDDVPLSVLNAHERPSTPHVFTGELCRTKLHWVWSRRPHQICFEDGCEDYILDKATHLSQVYSSDIPVVEPSEQRIRLARLAVAMAGVLFSHDGSGENLMVKKEHVELVLEFLQGVYNSPAMRYDKFSKAKQQATVFTQAQVKECVAVLKRQAENSGGVGDRMPALIMYLSENDEIDRNGMADQTGWAFEHARQFIQMFTSKIKGLRPGPNKKLLKTPLLVAALRQLDSDK